MLHGMPGCGKFKLVSIVIEELLSEIKKEKSSAPIAYFYCTRSPAEKERSDPAEVLRNLLKQLLCATSEIPIRHPVVREYRVRKEKADLDGTDVSPLDIDEAVKIMLALTAENTATIIVDALDECQLQSRWQLFKALDRLVYESGNLVKVFVSSRDDGDILKKLKHSPKIPIAVSDNHEDIDRFTRSEIAQTFSDGRLLNGGISSRFEQHIISTLIRDARGMFRWVEMQIKNLRDPQRIKLEEDVYVELTRLPKTLMDTYEVHWLLLGLSRLFDHLVMLSHIFEDCKSDIISCALLRAIFFFNDLQDIHYKALTARPKLRSSFKWQKIVYSFFFPQKRRDSIRYLNVKYCNHWHATL